MKSIAKGFMGTGFLVLLAGCSGAGGDGGGQLWRRREGENWANWFNFGEPDGCA